MPDLLADVGLLGKTNMSKRVSALLSRRDGAGICPLFGLLECLRSRGSGYCFI
jgi:hypothetical protein